MDWRETEISRGMRARLLGMYNDLRALPADDVSRRNSSYAYHRRVDGIGRDFLLVYYIFDSQY